MKAFFAAIRKTKDDLIFSLIVSYGLRVCELTRLQLADIDFHGRQLRGTAPKGGLTRTEDIPADICQKFEAWLRKRGKANYLLPAVCQAGLFRPIG